MRHLQALAYDQDRRRAVGGRVELLAWRTKITSLSLRKGWLPGTRGVTRTRASVRPWRDAQRSDPQRSKPQQGDAPGRTSERRSSEGQSSPGRCSSSTNLIGAILKNANFSGAFLFWTVFGAGDLTNVIGLETCIHHGPSIIDHRTLQRSGPLPLSFLRGVGLPDNLIEYLPSLLNQAIQHYSCFISYSTKDQEFAERLHADLQNKGVRCWFAPHDLPIGAKTWDAIDAAIKLRDKLVLILSKNSINSDWVEDEVQKAFRGRTREKAAGLVPGSHR